MAFTTTCDLLKQRYGLLLTTDDVAEVLRLGSRSIYAMTSKNTGVGAILNQRFVRIGRRKYYPAAAIAEIIDNGSKL